jgi:F0F1-type ATP synthase membrane subunit c/vacuolar-type H+-ATPase subunit K
MIIGQAVTQTSTIFALTISLIFVTLVPENTIIKSFALMGAAISMGLGAIGPGIGDGFVAKSAITAVANEPKNMALLTRSMVLGQAVTETTDVYALVVALLLIFVV